MIQSVGPSDHMSKHLPDHDHDKDKLLGVPDHRDSRITRMYSTSGRRDHKHPVPEEYYKIYEVRKDSTTTISHMRQ